MFLFFINPRMFELNLLQSKQPQFIFRAIDKLLIQAGVRDISSYIRAPQPQVFQHWHNAINPTDNLHMPRMAGGMLRSDVRISVQQDIPAADNLAEPTDDLRVPVVPRSGFDLEQHVHICSGLFDILFFVGEEEERGEYEE